MCAYAPSGAQGSPATTGPGTSEGDVGTTGTRAGGTIVVVTTTLGAGSGAALVGGGEGGGTGLGGGDGARVEAARRSEVARFAVVGGAAEAIGGAGGSTYWPVKVGGGVTRGAAS